MKSILKRMWLISIMVPCSESKPVSRQDGHMVTPPPTGFTIPSSPPQSPNSITILPSQSISSALEITWTPPLDDGGADILAYKVEWDGHGGEQEVQRITLTGAPTTGHFKLNFDGAITERIFFDATSDQVACALNSLSNIGHVEVEKMIDGWKVTFIDNVGNQPLLRTSDVTFKNKRQNYHLVISEEVEGTPPYFDQGTVGIYTMPLGSAVVKSLSPEGPVPLIHVVESLGSSLYFVRISSFNGVSWSAPRLAPFAVSPSIVISSTNPAPKVSPNSLSPPFQKPGRPTDVKLVRDSDGSIRVLFNAPDNDGGVTITKYKIEWDTSSSFSSGVSGGVLGSHHMIVARPVVGACGLTPCEYTISGLTNEASYYVRIFSYNKFGFSKDSVTLNAPPRIMIEPSPPHLVQLQIRC
mmetsp:Transcript_28759/g.37129  ORF Transcript_28759/g.37129 Transcript_28759/m.37129 type:complete len:411 (+) Transcript_28759:98-1330(+)